MEQKTSRTAKQSESGGEGIRKRVTNGPVREELRDFTDAGLQCNRSQAEGAVRHTRSATAPLARWTPKGKEKSVAQGSEQKSPAASAAMG